MQQKITQLGEPVLREKARDLSLEEIRSSEIQDLIELMKETMRKAPGVGLAAPQIGISLQIAVIEDRKEYIAATPQEILNERGREAVDFHVIINPKITHTDKTEILFFEGCLSVNGRCRITPRAKSVRVECLDEQGNKKIINAIGWYARILQHEIDHLNGKLFIDISDERTEISSDDYRSKWMNASQEEMNKFLNESLKK